MRRIALCLTTSFFVACSGSEPVAEPASGGSPSPPAGGAPITAATPGSSGGSAADGGAGASAPASGGDNHSGAGVAGGEGAGPASQDGGASSVGGSAAGGAGVGGSSVDVGGASGEAGMTGTMNGDGLDCDHRGVICRIALLPCPDLQVREVVDGCYGECVPIGSCACTAAAECPDELQYTCIRSTGRCSPYLQ